MRLAHTWSPFAYTDAHFEEPGKEDIVGWMVTADGHGLSDGIPARFAAPGASSRMDLWRTVAGQPGGMKTAATKADGRRSFPRNGERDSSVLAGRVTSGDLPGGGAPFLSPSFGSPVPSVGLLPQERGEPPLVMAFHNAVNNLRKASE